MTIQKRDKRKRRAVKAPAEPPFNKMVGEPVIKKAIHYPRVCPFCGKEGFSTMCRCGRLTRIK